MRYFRVVLNPSSSVVINGSTTLRMRFALTNQMIYATFVDGGYVAVPDDEMGAWGGCADSVLIDPLTTPYLMFQESAPEIPLESITLWSTQLVPYSTDPQVQPTPWPATVVIPG